MEYYRYAIFPLVTTWRNKNRNGTIYRCQHGSFGFAVINAQPQGNGINQPTTYYCGYLTENTKYAIIYGYMGGGINPFAQAIMSGTKYAQETALMPPIAAVELDLPAKQSSFR